MAGNSLSSRYFRSMEEADEIVLASGASRIRHMSYGTVIYTPPFSGRGEEVARIDFGSEIATKKQLFCPRILLISTWTDGKFGFTGGGKEETESPVETMNREFLEEIGTSMNFTIKDDYCFSYMEVLNPNDIRLMSIFCRVTSNLVEFNALLASFHSDTREAYIDEVFTAVGLPLFLEGPEDVVDKGKVHPNSVQGLPRFINYQGGIFSRRPNHKIYIVREQFLLVLLFKKVISQALMKRVFFLGSIFDDSKEQPSWPEMGTFENLLERPGVSELLL